MPKAPLIVTFHNIEDDVEKDVDCFDLPEGFYICNMALAQKAFVVGPYPTHEAAEEAWIDPGVDERIYQRVANK